MTDYAVRTDLAAMDLDLVHDWLSTDAYWSVGRSQNRTKVGSSRAGGAR